MQLGRTARRLDTICAMPDRSSKRPRDPNQLAKLVVDIATGEADDPAIPAHDGRRRSGKAGGKARADALSAERRQAIAKKAARTRWAAQQAPK
jgi:hypothetical protein